VTSAEFRGITEQRAWKAYAQRLLGGQTLDPDAKRQFDLYWIEAGHHIREQVGDDRLLVQLLRHLLPPYDGAAVLLFRGENHDRWTRGAVGLGWTKDLEVARMFGRGVNAVHSGGVLLRAHFEPGAIISGPNWHSNHLGESQFTVDPLDARGLSVVEVFAPVP
jgi:hypothetical protein